LRNGVLENTFTYRFRPTAVLGWNLIVNPSAQNLTKYDFGVVCEPTNNLLVGIRHVSTSENKLEFGKFLLHFFHQASATQTIGSEFSLDWQKKALEARFGLQHVFSSDVTGKFRVNHLGFADAALKYKLSSSVTVTASSGLDLKGISDAKAKQLPVGFTFDLKL